jgi:hypothetical protein
MYYKMYLLIIILIDIYSSLLFIIMHLESRHVLPSQYGRSQHLELISPPLSPTLSLCLPSLIPWPPLRYLKQGFDTQRPFHIVAMSFQGILKLYRCDHVPFALSFGAQHDSSCCLNLQGLHLAVPQEEPQQ